MKKTKKEALVKQLVVNLKEAEAVYLADFSGLDVEGITELRRVLRTKASESGNKIELEVSKNTLIRIAANEVGIKGLEPYLTGPTALTFSYSDVAMPAKILTEFSKTHDNKPKVKAGVVEGNVFSADQVKVLATIPPREVLLSQVLGALQSPIRGFASVLQGTISKLVRTIDAVAKAKESQ